MSGVGVVGEHDGVLDGLVATLAEGRGHGVGRVAEEGGPAAAFFDATGRHFHEPLTSLLRAVGSRDPERHTLSLVAWSEGMMFSCVAGAFHSSAPGLEGLREGFGELLRGMLGASLS